MAALNAQQANSGGFGNILSALATGTGAAIGGIYGGGTGAQLGAKAGNLVGQVGANYVR